MSKPLRAVIYARVSTDEQATSGLGLEAQRAAAEALIERRGWSTVSEPFVDTVSGKVAPTKRPELAKALDLLCDDRADVLVVESVPA